MRAGELRHRIKILMPHQQADGAGGQSQEWVTYGEAWAAVEPQSGGEMMKADQVRSIRRFVVRTRYRTDIDTTMRLEWAGVTMDVRAVVDPLGRHERLEIACEEVPGNGQG